MKKDNMEHFLSSDANVYCILVLFVGLSVPLKVTIVHHLFSPRCSITSLQLGDRKQELEEASRDHQEDGGQKWEGRDDFSPAAGETEEAS